MRKRIVPPSIQLGRRNISHSIPPTTILIPSHLFPFFLHLLQTSSPSHQDDVPPSRRPLGASYADSYELGGRPKHQSSPAELPPEDSMGSSARAASCRYLLLDFVETRTKERGRQGAVGEAGERTTVRERDEGDVAAPLQRQGLP